MMPKTVNVVLKADEKMMEVVDEAIEKLRPVVERLETENAELKAHIERWAMWREQNHKQKVGREYCIICEFKWPCPTEVAKGFENEH